MKNAGILVVPHLRYFSAFGGDYPGCIFFSCLSCFWAAWGALQETQRVGCVIH